MAIDLQNRSHGRHTVLCEEIWDSLVKSAENGNYISVACQAAGIHPTTYSNWLGWAKDVEEYIYNNNIDIESSELDVSVFPENVQKKYVYYRLFCDLKTAQAKSIVKRNDLVMAAGHAGPQYWMAAMTSLERTNPELYAKRDAIDISVKDSQVLLEKLAKALKAGE
jgi:hypothetical protein